MSAIKITAISMSVVLLIGVVFFCMIHQRRNNPIDTQYMNSSLSLDERVENLLAQMTLEEKIGQMALVEKNSIQDIEDIAEYGLGGMLSGGGAKPETNTPAGWLEMVQKYDEASRTSRLGIPVLYGIDAIHGHSNVPGATLFPHSIALGATGNTELVEQIAQSTAEEVRATGIVWMFSPNLDSPEDTRWGRTYEAFSSDPALNAKMGEAYIRGVQGVSIGTSAQMIATAKHFIGAGGMVWGSSSNENFKIDQGTTPEDDEKLRSVYLPPFKAAVDAGVLSIMAGLNSYGDQKVSANTYLLTDILKTELGFKGFVVSDWYAVGEIPGGEYVAVVTAINAGIDMVMLPYDYKAFVKNMKKAVRENKISEERINDAVRRILRAKFAVGLFEGLPKIDSSVIGSDEHRALARRAVAESLNIIKNEDQTVPIVGTKKIRVVGSAADNTGRQSGGWTIEWQGVDGNVVPGATSIFEGIREVMGPNTTIVSEGPADIGIAVVGERPYAEGWGDTENPSLAVEDIETIEQLRKEVDRVVVVIISGRSLALPPEAQEWDTIVEAWLPGSEGAGVADVLFGATLQP